MKNLKKVKLACYTTNVSMSIIANLSPVLFITFRSMYGLSFSLLGLLIVINFVTQLLVDLIFSFFSHKFNHGLMVKIAPVLTVIGLIIYGTSPYIFASNVYIGLVIGTIIFSASSGLVEVLLTPVIAALPSDNPDKEVSKLHSIYAWGIVTIIIFSTLFLELFGKNNWWILSLVFCLVPLFACIMFFTSKLPALETPEKLSNIAEYFKNKWLWICVFAIFLGGAIECTMAQWASGFIESALGIPKVWGDILGVALFAVFLGFGRTLYSKKGKNIEKVLLLGAIGSLICYTLAVFSPVPVIGLIACVITGLCVSMMWPGSLIVASNKFPTAGVFIYAIMAAGGDLGASVAPQTVGVLADVISNSSFGLELAVKFGLSPEQIGIRAGMLIGAILSLVAILIFVVFYKRRKKENKLY